MHYNIVLFARFIFFSAVVRKRLVYEYLSAYVVGFENRSSASSAAVEDTVALPLLGSIDLFYGPSAYAARL